MLKRMLIAYLFFFLTSVSLGRGDEGCLELYKSCGQLISNMKGDPPCSIGSRFMKCLVDTTDICFPTFKDTVEKYKNLFEEGCQPRSPFFHNAAQTIECLSNESDPFQSCELEGEFETAAEICWSFSNLIDCARLRTEIVCGKKSGNVFQKILRPIQDLLDDCKNSQEAKDTETDVCYKELLKCDRRIFASDEYACPELQRVAKCYLDVAVKDCNVSEGIFIKMTRKYIDQIPDYCNPQSTVSQSYEKNGACIFVKFGVLEPCHVDFTKALSKAFEHHSQSKESQLAFARSSIKYRDCSEEKLGTACGDDAAYVTRFALNPLVAVADDTCIELTGDKCNGAVTVKCTILLLILSLKYILMKED